MTMKTFSKRALCVSALVFCDFVVGTRAGGSVVKSVNDLDFDENGKLTSHNLVYPSGNPACPAAAHRYYGYETHAVDDDALNLIFPEYQKGDCLAACLERGTDRSVAGHTLPSKHYDAKTDKDFYLWFRNSCTKMEVCLINYYSKERPISIFWIEPRKNEAKFSYEVKYGERNTHCFKSYLGHKFEARDGDKLIEAFTIEHVLIKAFGQSPPSASSTKRSFDREIESALKHEWDRHNVVKRTFSSLGFAKGRLPPDLFANMGSFYYNNRHNKVNEEWNNKGYFVNWWESTVSFIQIPWDIKVVWQARLAELVSAWAGVPVEQTSMYGLRQYEDGARLLSHVDRLPTHAVSLIVNVAQGNLTEPWPVEVFDHADRLHEVIMQPGDIVYYESAKNLHSRNRALMGKDAYFVNLFTHYRPVNDGENWHKVLDQPGVPPAVTDDIVGGCQSSYTGDTSIPLPEQFGSVKCDDKRLGSYISPTLFQLKGPEDLITWWRKTAPGYVDEEAKETPAEDRDEL